MNKYTEELLAAIDKILQRGNVAEIKKEHGKLVVVEIDRRVKYKE